MNMSKVSNEDILSLLNFYLETMTEMLRRAEQSDDLDLLLKIHNTVDEWQPKFDTTFYYCENSIKQNKKVQEILDSKPSKEVLLQSVNITDEYLKKS